MTLLEESARLPLLPLVATGAMWTRTAPVKTSRTFSATISLTSPAVVVIAHRLSLAVVLTNGSARAPRNASASLTGVTGEKDIAVMVPMRLTALSYLTNDFILG